MPSERPEGLRQQQLLFANHVRNPSAFPAPVGVEERRMRIYRQLFFGNISQLLSTTFPVIRSILDDKKWEALVADFYAMHRCETPLFPFIAGEFADYVVNERNAEGDYPFLAELAQYEWSEIALRHSDAVLPDAELPDVDGSKPMLSPLCWPMVFSFPVHRIGINYLPQHAPPRACWCIGRVMAWSSSWNPAPQPSGFCNCCRMTRYPRCKQSANSWRMRCSILTLRR